MYNIKLIEYPNNTAQLRVYKTVVGVPQENTSSKKRKEKDTEESQKRSIAHTKSMISTYARCNTWEWFVTLTFSPELTDRTDFKKCMQRVRNFLKNSRRKAKNLKYLVVPELHSDKESWHAHILLSNTGDLTFLKSGKKKHYKEIYNVPGWKYGFSTATKIEDTRKVSKYILKYITKDAHVLQKHSNRYYVSKNLDLPKETNFLVPGTDTDIFSEILIDSLGMDITWEKTKSNSYTSIKYIELE